MKYSKWDSKTKAKIVLEELQNNLKKNNYHVQQKTLLDKWGAVHNFNWFFKTLIIFEIIIRSTSQTLIPFSASFLSLLIYNHT